MSRRRVPNALFLLLGLSAGLRFALAFSGGQRFCPDEDRYLRSFVLFAHLERGEWGPAIDYLLDHPDHTGFIVVGVVPAAIQRLLITSRGSAINRGAVDATGCLPAMLLSLASVASIALVYAIARRACSDDEEAVSAALLMACANSMFYYSRHLLPYDAALVQALFALYFGLDERGGAARSLAVGLLAGLAFLTYNGYWIITAIALGVHVLWRPRPFAAAVRRGAIAGLGLAALPLALEVVSALRNGSSYLVAMERFSRAAATQADFGEGWSLPWAYLWHAEHGLSILLLLGCALALRAAARERGTLARRAILGVGGALVVYGLIVLFSTGLGRIGAWGRQVRQMLPFLCIATACGVTHLLRAAPRGQRAMRVAAVGLLAQAAANFYTPLSLHFPRDVAGDVVAEYGEVSRDTTILGASNRDIILKGRPRYVLVNAGYLHPIGGTRPAPEGRTLLRFEHPLTFLPYQYEGFLPGERSILRTSDISIRLIDRKPQRKTGTAEILRGPRV